MSSNDLERAAFQALRDGDADTLRRLLAQGLDPNAKEPVFGLSLAFSSLRCPSCLSLLVKAGADLESRPASMAPIAYCAAIDGFDAALEVLIQAGVDLEAGALSLSPLAIACGRGHTRCAALLIQAGARLDARDDQAMTPFLISCATSQISSLRLLIDKGANWALTNAQGLGALEMAAKYGSKECEDFLSGFLSAKSVAQELDAQTPAAQPGAKPIRI